MPESNADSAIPGQFSRWLPSSRRRRAFTRWLSPARFLVLSFAGLIVGGTLGFRFLPGLYVGESLGWIDSLFMATSAVCVTGLTVVDPGTYFTFYGQLWSLILIQLGGLGLLTLTSGILLTVGRRLSLRHEELMRSTGETNPKIDYRLLIRRVLLFTAAIELTGAAVLFTGWYGELGAADAAWAALFHAVSAFCNAGFSIFPNNLVAFQSDPLALGVVMSLIVLGGLGFLTLTELSRWLDRRSMSRRISLHSRITLLSTGIALVLGALAFGVFEWHNTLSGLTVSERIVNSLFGSVTARTAGFATVNYGNLSGPAAFATVILMFIGGAPGSTAGGVKVTTIAVLVAMAWARLKGEKSVSAFSRTVPDETLGRAAAIIVIAAAILIVAIFLLIALDPLAGSPDVFLRYMFEAVSAFGTVGLSMDLTPSLSPAARLIIVALMFIGRVGIMSFVAALALQPRTLAFRYAREDVAVG